MNPEERLQHVRSCGQGTSNEASKSSIDENFKIWHTSEIDHWTRKPTPATIVWEWIKTYILKPNTALGHQGPVCPFVPGAVKMDSLYMSVIDENVRDVDELCRILQLCVEKYKTLAPIVPHEFKAFVVVFPGIIRTNRDVLMVQAHQRMKPAIVNAGLMLGEFYPESESPSVRNADFRPLRSPMALFVIRQMVETDLIFLNQEKDPPELRLAFINAYLRALEKTVSREWVTKARTAIALLEVRARERDAMRGTADSRLL